MGIPKKGPSFPSLLVELIKEDDNFLLRGTKPEIRGLIERANNEGWNWEQCGYHASQAGLSQKQFWALVKMARAQGRLEIPLRDRRGKLFSYRLPPSAQRVLHVIDKHLGGTIESSFPQLDTPPERTRYLITSLVEEAIASSQIEGAAVTRAVAKEMLQTGRQPRNRDERMILNNYRMIQMLNRRTEPLTIPLLHEIQSQLTELVLDKPGARGRFRRSSEKVTVWDEEEQQALHVPPPAEELIERSEQLCTFANLANSADNPGSFIHPAIRAILLHFWLAYDHPYVDGNGRTARALFYWSMLKSGYWLVEYLTISTIIREQPKQYARAFLNTERDDNDLTYFILYHLEVIERSLHAFQEYLDRKMSERKRRAQVLLPALFNQRQQAILLKALREPDTRFTYESHARAQGVTLATARSDLLDLEAKDLLRGNRVGRRFEFVAVPDLEERLRRLAAATD
jgi:Fic family protein